MNNHQQFTVLDHMVGDVCSRLCSHFKRNSLLIETVNIIDSCNIDQLKIIKANIKTFRSEADIKRLYQKLLIH